MADATKTHVTLLASPDMGHLTPTLELAKRLVLHHRFTATLFVATFDISSTPHKSILDPSSLPPSHLLQVIPLPVVAAAFDAVATPIVKSRLFMRSVLPQLRLAITSRLPSPPAALFVDLLGTEALDIADEFGMKKYVFFTTSAWFLGLALYLPGLEKEKIKPDEEVVVPGCRPIRYRDLPSVVWEWDGPDYAECARVGSETAKADGILVNTWEELEPKSITALRNNEVLSRFIHETPIHPIGPITRLVGPNGAELNRVMSSLHTWLEEQPRESVLYVCFGSGGTLSSRQTIELANGLLRSQQRFVWVIRPPAEFEEEAEKMKTGSKDDFREIISRFLPDEFLDRTREVGRTILMWAPQAEILAHPAVGGFLTHCGWNSTLESVVNGVPIIAWPLYAEQNMNATYLCEEVKVAIRLETREEMIGREEIEKMVRKTMVDDRERVKERAKELQTSAQKALSEGGSSANSLAHVAKECEFHALQR